MSMNSSSLGTADGLARSRLSEIAVPELYEQNAFRVLGLTVDASVRDVRRKQKKVERSERLGLKSNHRGGFLPLTPPPGEDETRKAMHRIQDPIARFLDEFFWFWPREVAAKNDDVLALLWRRRVQDAHKLWLKYEAGTSSDKVSTHNLAVLYHVSALDFEQRLLKEDLTEEEHKTRVGCWQRAYGRWQSVLRDKDFWNRVRKRILEIDDPQLPPQAVDEIRDCLGKAVLLIHARIATRAAEGGNIGGAQQHVAIMRKSGLAPSLVEDALRESVRNVRQRIKMLCDAAEPAADSDPRNAHTVTWNLLRDAGPLLVVIDAVLPGNDAMRLGAHDEVANKALRCQVTYGNKTQDWHGSLKMLEAVLKFAGTDTMRARLNENIETVKGNIAFAICYYCGKNQRVESAAVEVKMYGNVRRYAVPGEFGRYRVTWQQKTVRVPRCQKCKDVHSERALRQLSEPPCPDNGRKEAFEKALGFLGVVAGIVVCVVLSDRVRGWDWRGGVLLTIMLGVLLGSLGRLVDYLLEEGNRKALLLLLNPAATNGENEKADKEIRDFKSYVVFPGVRESLSQGWREGEEPSEWEQRHAPEIDLI